ncbi:MAG: cysteine--tRNA ligase [Nanoarchaeota archaeon]|nr:cysteine--tRNA ligase [Nanoarchaeota archaeon]MBU1028126.1 cysteine--tRNA ligase [Nanoarchaeota archaeon]
MIKLYNTLTRKKENFKSLKPKQVGLYSCGPTVYWYQHIGNLKMYLSWDILKRVLKYGGYNVKHVINVTDVGHLTSDADTGEDKIEKAAKKERKSAKEISNYYFDVFKQDIKKLNIIEPDVWPKASEHIKEQIELIKVLEKKDFTYKTNDGIYFDTSKLKDYGKLARLKKENLKAGKRIDIGEKKHKTDFALWKFSEIPGKRQQEWKSPWGIGFPGWHLECSAMSSKYLGKQFDIHTGGPEHIAVHHTNEIAQSETAFGKKPWVKYWLHGAWVLFKGKKVSKSKGGLYTLDELQKQGYTPLELRYLVLGTHYRKPLHFNLKNLKKAQESYSRLKNIISEINNDNKINKIYLDKFQEAINDDLNIPKALQVLWKLARDEKAKGKINTIKKIDEVLGLDLLKKEKVKIPNKIKKLVGEREAARKNKDWNLADEIRNKINKLGYLVDDTEKGSVVRKFN